MLEIETYMKNFYKRDIVLNPNTIPESADSAVKCCLCEKQLGKEVHVTETFSLVRDKAFAEKQLLKIFAF